MFDVERLKIESGLEPHKLVRLEESIKEEFKGDEMMFELHFVRVLSALRKGWISLEDAFSQSIKV